MKKDKKNPWVAAVLNFLLPGAGYLYVGKREIFGGLLLISLVPAIIGEIIAPSPFNLALLFAEVIIIIAFAYDGFEMAKEVNKQK